MQTSGLNRGPGVDQILAGHSRKEETLLEGRAKDQEEKGQPGGQTSIRNSGGPSVSGEVARA